MEKFWAAILIFVVVAAAGLMYVNQVYIPQKDSQAAMADMATDTLSAVKLEIGDGTINRERRGDQILETIEDYLEDDDITIYIDGTPYTDDISDIEGKVDSSSNYNIEIIREDGKTTEVNITKK